MRFQLISTGRQPAFLLSHVDISFPTAGLSAILSAGHCEEKTVWLLERRELGEAFFNLSRDDSTGISLKKIDYKL